MINLKNSVAAMRPVKEEMDLDNEDVFCGEVNELMMDAEQIDTSTDSVETNFSNMQHIVCTDDDVDDDDDDDDDVWETKIDHGYMKLLDSFREDGNSNFRDNPLMSIRYEVDNGSYDKREFKPVPVTNNRKSREDLNTIRVTKSKTKKTMKEADFGLRRRESLVTKKSVEAMVITRNSQYNDEASKKKNVEAQIVLDENYRSYLTWLVETSKSSRTNPQKEIQVKCEEHTMSESDSDIIAIEDCPFLDEDDSPFVPSKNHKVIDLDEESGDQDSSSFRKEIMNVLKQPYNEQEFKELYKEASLRRCLTRCRQLRDGRELSYDTNQKTPSYIDEYSKFKKMFNESLREKDNHRALNLLRGLVFYITKVARHDAFKPWLDQECLKIT